MTLGAGVVAGQLITFAGTTPPSGYLTCPTAATTVSRTTYADLFAAIGTTWGAGDGSTTFGIPWFAANYAMTQASSNVGTATVGENLSHTHQIQGSFVSSAAGGSLYDVGASAGTSSGASGGTANLAASTRVLFCVKF
jgi:microcystin-dependent protein